MRYFLLIFLLALVLGFTIAGKRGSISRKPPIEIFPDMDRQPKVRPQKPSIFFADGRQSRLPVQGTIARGEHFLEIPQNTGMIPGSTNFVAVNPVAVTPQLMARGQQRFQINCSPCHGLLADGNGITKQFGMGVVGNLHDPRIVQMTDGEMFFVITHGRNLMGPYESQVTPEDRWAIIAYVRALQLSQLGDAADLPEAQRAAFAK
jgi:mono/diheme cytochrome c family protein